MRNSSLLIIAGAATTLAAGLLYVLAPSTNRVAAEQVSAEQTAGRGPLDGLTFVGAVGPLGEAKDVPDRFLFENGAFVSKECELRCNYPARPYFVRQKDGATEFISQTKCPDKDAKIVWRGTVDGNRISGVSTWTLRRWYWTIERKFAFEGRLNGTNVPGDGASAPIARAD